MRRLLVLRHGQTAWNLEGRWQGWLDVELDAVGHAQAQARARQLAAGGLTFAGVASSPLARALTTARVAAEALGIAEIRTYPGLRERHGGHWQGLTRDDIQATWPDELHALRHGEIDAPPGGETTAAMLARLDDALTTVDRDMPAGPVLVVTHGGIARALAVRAGATESGVLANVGGLWITYHHGRVALGATLEPLEHDPAEPEGRLPTAPEIVASDAVTNDMGTGTN